MKEFVILFLIGLGVGSLGTLIGAGGGFILVPVLLLLKPNLDPHVATSISLFVVFLNASSGSIAYWRMKRIDYKTAVIFSLASLPGAVLGAYLTETIAKRLFDVVLGITLVLIALFLLIKPRLKMTQNETPGKKLVTRSIVDSRGQSYTYSFKISAGVVISFVVGFLSSLLGIGGGIIHVPAMTVLLHFPIVIATATSHFVLMMMALAGTVVHIVQGDLDGHWLTAIYIGCGVIIGAQVGAYFSHFAKPHWIIKALAFALLLVGIRILFMY